MDAPGPDLGTFSGSSLQPTVDLEDIRTMMQEELFDNAQNLNEWVFPADEALSNDPPTLREIVASVTAPLEHDEEDAELAVPQRIECQQAFDALSILEQFHAQSGMAWSYEFSAAERRVISKVTATRRDGASQAQITQFFCR